MEPAELLKKPAVYRMPAKPGLLEPGSIKRDDVLRFWNGMNDLSLPARFARLEVYKDANKDDLHKSASLEIERLLANKKG